MPSQSLTAALRETLAFFNDGGTPKTTHEVADHLDLGQRSTYTRLKRLVEHNELETKKVGASARVWWRPPINADRESPGWHAAAESLIDDANAGMFVFDADGQLKWINDAAERYFGLDRDQIVGQDKQSLLTTHLTPAVVESELFTSRVQSTTDEATSTEQFNCHVTAGAEREERWLAYHMNLLETGEYAGGHVDLYYDITDRKQTEHVLEESDQRYSTLISNLPGMVYRCRNESKWPMEFVSSGCTDLTGYDAEAVESGTVSWGDDVIHPDDRGQVWEAVQSGLERDGEFTIQYRVQTADDNTQWVRERGHLLSDTSDSSTMLEGIITDITAQKMTELELRERDVEDVVERIDDGFVALDENLRFTYVNDRAGDILKRLPGELVGEHITDAFEPDPEIDAAITEALKTQKPTAVETFYEPLETWFGFHLYPTERGIPVYFEDVTERKEQTHQLEQYERVVETIDDGIYVLDSDHRFTMVNNGFTSMTEYGRDDLIGAHAEVVFGDDFLENEEVKQTEPELGTPLVENFEEDIHTASGSPLTVESRFTLFKYESGEIGRVGVVRDVTDRVKREQRLVRLANRYQTLIDHFPNGAVVLFDEELRCLTAGGEIFDGLSFSTDDLEGDLIAERFPEKIVDEIEPRFTAAIDGDENEFEIKYEGQVRHITAFPVYDEQGAVFAGMAMSQDVTDYIDQKQRLERQREHLVALNHINDVVYEIHEAVTQQSTREEIETIVCERLADMDSYEFAWIGDIDSSTVAVKRRAEAGTGGYLDDITISVGPDDQRSSGPTGRALLQREIQTTQDIHTDSKYSPWRESAQEHGVRSSAAIPIVYDETLYGVLNVCSEWINAFVAEELEVIGRLGEIIGHAITAVERKRALMSDEVIELEFQLPNIFEKLDADARTDDRISLDRTVPTGDATYLLYGTTTGDGLTGLKAVIDQLSHWDSITVLDDEGDIVRFEVLLTEPPILSAVASQGGYVDMAQIENGHFDLCLHLAPGTDACAMTDTVLERYPAAELRSQRQITRTDDAAPRVQQIVQETLTNRQQSSLEAAYNSGFFEWPRTTSGEDVADSLGVSPPTFHQHLRKAEQKVFTAILETSMVSS